MTKHKQQPMLKRGLQTGKYASEFELLFLIKMLQYCQWIKDNTNFKPWKRYTWEGGYFV